MNRFFLSKEEKIKSTKEFSAILSSGAKITSDDKKLRAVFVISESINSPIRVGIAVSKRIGNAVHRNRVKRLIREAFRLNKHKFTIFKIENSHSLSIIVLPYKFDSYFNRKPYLKDIFGSMESLIFKINKALR